ncbi:MAG TPA: hypothetical protein VMW80_11295 [Candidatus Dormibacteraeota bacterium]|nr:hypothetical protein [Candidatus Dormibacteraeota bacterium]
MSIAGQTSSGDARPDLPAVSTPTPPAFERCPGSRLRADQFRPPGQKLGSGAPKALLANSWLAASEGDFKINL